MKTPTLLFAALLLLLQISGIPATSSVQTQFGVLVTNSVTNPPPPNSTYSTYVSFRGILIGGLRRLQNSNTGFKFTYIEDPNYGPYLQSVNGLDGCAQERTYWELKVKKPNGRVIRPNVGIGCYIPSANDQIILNYNKY